MAALQLEAKLRRAREARKRRWRFDMAALRTSEIQKFFMFRYGEGGLPDDDAGRDDLAILLHHAAKKPGSDVLALARLAAHWAQWMAPEERSALIERIFASPCSWRADALAKALGLTFEVRQQLKIRTIGAVDMTKSKRTQMRADRKRQHDREYQRRRRAEKGAPKVPLSKAKPWEEQGISRATYYRHLRQGGETKKSSGKSGEPHQN